MKRSIIASLGLVLIGCGGFLFWKDSNLKDPVPSQHASKIGAAKEITGSFIDLNRELAKLPENHKWRNKRKKVQPLLGEGTPQSQDEMLRVMNAAIQHYQQNLSGSFNWYREYGYTYPADQVSFLPYTTQVNVEAETELFIRGDLHSDIHSLRKEITQLIRLGYLDGDYKIIKPRFRMVFLGDYINRGYYGLEVLYVLLRIKLANPGLVTLVRGNHESDQIYNRHGFRGEVLGKFPGAEGKSVLKKVVQLFELFPAAAFYGHLNQYMQFCHGGIEPFYNPIPFLESGKKFHRLDRLVDDSFVRLPEMQKFPSFTRFNALRSALPLVYKRRNRAPGNGRLRYNYSLMWGDFAVNSQKELDYVYGRGFRFGGKLVRAYFDHVSTDLIELKGIMRAHQHSGNPENELMQKLAEFRGVYSHFGPEVSNKEKYELGDRYVWTLNLGPDTLFGRSFGLVDDYYVMLKIAGDYSNWQLRTVQTISNRES